MYYFLLAFILRTLQSIAMKIVTFIENRFQELRLAEDADSKRQAYSILRSSETLACQWILKVLRNMAQVLMVPKVIVQYVLVCARLLPEPQPVLLNMLKEQKAEAEQKDLEAKAKKVGMLEMVQKIT